MQRPQRISVVGNSGSGKSTAAARVASRLGIERLELDSVRHQPNWRELPDDEFRRRVVAFMADHGAWIIDGNYSVVRPEVWARADTVLWLDPPFAENMCNIIGRTLRRVVTRQVLWNGNRERWTNLLSLDPYRSVIAWAWMRHGLVRRRYEAAARDPEWWHLRFVRIRSRSELDEWLARQGGVRGQSIFRNAE